MSPGIDGADVYPRARKLGAEGVGDGDERGLRRAVHAEVGRGDLAGQGRDVDDVPAPLPTHVGDGRLNAVDGAPEVDGEQVMHVVHTAGRYRREQPHAGVVHQHVDAVELLHGAPHQRLHGQAIGHVRRHHQSPAGVVGELRRQGVQLLAVARGEDDVRPAAGELAGGLAADPG